MPIVIIADSSKPSVVMTSEIFKDKVPGVVVHIADTGREALELTAQLKPDLVIIDFDLPDADGPSLVEALREDYAGPILMTAYPDKTVEAAVAEHLFTYADASDWLKKPVSSAALSKAIENFLLNGKRTERRFESDLSTQLIAKAAGRGKRAPKVFGKVINLSVGGACVKLDGGLKLKKSQELVLALAFPDQELLEIEETKAPIERGKPKKVKLAELVKEVGSDAKIRAKVAWVAPGKVGLIFNRLSTGQKKYLITYLRKSKILFETFTKKA